MNRIINQSKLETMSLNANLRDSIIIDLLGYLRLRPREITLLKKHDFDYRRRMLKVNGKRPQILLLLPTIAERIRMLLSYRSDDSSYLFVNREGNQISLHTVVQILRSIQ